MATRGIRYKIDKKGSRQVIYGYNDGDYNDKDNYYYEIKIGMATRKFIR